MKGKPNFNPQLARSKVTPRAANNRSKITNGVGPFAWRAQILFVGAQFLTMFSSCCCLTCGGENNCSEGREGDRPATNLPGRRLEQLEVEFGQGRSTPERLSLYSMLTDTTRRCLETLSSGLQRRQRDVTPTLGELLRADHAPRGRGGGLTA